MAPRTILMIAAVFIALMLFPRFAKIVPPGHVSVANLFGKIRDEPLLTGGHIVNPLLGWNDFDVRENALKALATMAKDPAAKIYFLDSNSRQPLPLLHMGDPPK